ncbi:MAG TPA: aldehyde dehydrogenase family protein [Baekduia sp.]|uniref:aldehyde dehydrogenase family protein n=1 Tax=Baekduia sp. TaxID=2600305 RepID=UPI002BBEB384|nr:aldehyde dehydrogenase family protein [Baekduia sp.]HMJ33870.1 aldehyde dehydrogenase family protein [Baekduia sp.]
MADAPSSAPDDAPTLRSVAPATGGELGTVPIADAQAVHAAVDEARAVQRLWAQLRLEDRARYMARAAQAVIDEAGELADLICREQGRPRAEVELGELVPAIETLQWLAEAGPRILAGERAGLSRVLHPLTRARWTYEPLGVVAVLGPAAEPFATPLGDVAVALMAGNGVVLKPSPHAALAGDRIGRVFARAGLPEGLLHVLHGHAGTGAALVEAAVAQVRFTGSARAGAKVLEACARDVKRAVAELGGQDAAIVCGDANVARAVEGIAWGAFANAGQSGGSIERVYVLRAVADRFLEDLLARTRGLRVGDPADPDTDVGPLVGGERLGRVTELLDEAVAQGAVLHCGGPVSVPGLPGAFCAPAVLTGVPAGARLAREEVPGPVVAVTVVDREEDAIAAVNDSPLGLGASVWTADRFKGQRIARELRVGMVWMNDHLVARGAPQLPWGGVRGSGIGRARGAIALRTCAEPKVVTWDPPLGRAFWWFPYDAALVRTGRAVAQLRSTRDADRERGLREGARPALRVAARTVRALRRR